ncbi:unnamed protein product [Leptidea sinapis]|uniref:Uncharacterized protein n=1 Tax=Leptidea sinapis TaxID=189913 RepID=A0A5E4PNR5_9NEOP|nr:unnamed protein product [Leptidea sinapis]
MNQKIVYAVAFIIYCIIAEVYSGSSGDSEDSVQLNDAALPVSWLKTLLEKIDSQDDTSHIQKIKEKLAVLSVVDKIKEWLSSAG